MQNIESTTQLTTDNPCKLKTAKAMNWINIYSFKHRTWDTISK